MRFTFAEELKVSMPANDRDVSAPKIDENKVTAALAQVFEPSDESTEEDEEGFKKPKTRKKQKKRRRRR